MSGRRRFSYGRDEEPRRVELAYERCTTSSSLSSLLRLLSLLSLEVRLRTRPAV